MAQSFGQIAGSWVTASFGVLLGAAICSGGWRVEGGALAILAFAPLFVFLDRQAFGVLPFGAMSLMYGTQALGFAIGPVWQLYTRGELKLVESAFAVAQWGDVVGLVTTALVFPRVFRAASGTGTGLESRSRAAAPDRADRYGVTLLFAGVALTSFGYLSGASDRLTGVMPNIWIASLAMSLESVHQVAFFFLARSAARRGGAWFGLWFAAIVLSISFWFLNGGRQFAITSVVISAMGFVFGGAVSRKVMSLLMLVLVVFVPLSAVVNIFRDYPVESFGTFAERVAAFRKATVELMEWRQDDAHNIFMDRVTALSVDRVFLSVPDIVPYAYLEDLGKIYWAFVPQVLKEDRPNLQDGNDLSIRFGAARPGTFGTFFPTVGDGYRRFGWIGIALVYAVITSYFAAAIGFCWARRLRSEYMATLVVLLMLTLQMWFTTLISCFYLALWFVPKHFVFFWVLARLVNLILIPSERLRLRRTMYLSTGEYGPGFLPNAGTHTFSSDRTACRAGAVTGDSDVCKGRR